MGHGMKPVTDPELLQALNEEGPARRVTDPNLLNQLNAPEPIFAPDETSLYDTPDVNPIGDAAKWIASGLKTFPGQIAASRYATMVREPAPIVGLAKLAFDDKWYGQQIGRLTPVQKANHAALTASKIESGYDKKTAWKAAYDEMFQASRDDGMKAADALERAKRLLFGTPDDPTAYAHAVENEWVRFGTIKELVRESKESDLWKPLPGYDKPKNIIENVLFGIGNSVLPNMLPMIVSPALGLPVMYAHIQGAAYQSMIEAGVPEERAAQAARWDAASQVPLEFAGNLFMLKGIMGATGWRKFVAGLAVSMGSEGMTEFAQQYPDEAAMAWALNPDITPGEMFDELTSGRTLKNALYAGAVGGLTGGLTHTVGGGVHLAYTTLKQARTDENKANVLADILVRVAKGEALDEEEQALFDRLNTLATESQKRRIMYQAPIKTPNRDKVYQGLIDSKLTRERAGAVMNIFDSIACSWADRAEGKLPGDFYEEVLTDYRPGTFADFQTRIDAEGMKRAAQYGQDGPDLQYQDESGINEPVVSKQGPGEKTTEATPKPDGGIKLEDGRVLPDGYYIKYEDDWGGKAWKVYTHDDALVGYDKSNKEWALNQAWQRVASGNIPNPKHKKLSSFAEADPNKLRELVGQKELFYRVHGKNEKFHKDLAFSSIIDGSNKRKGYSSYDNPEDLIDYWSGNNPSNRSISDDAEVVIYSGKKVGKGGDNEPLSVPDMKVVYRTTWKKLLSAVESNPNQPRPSEMGGKQYQSTPAGQPRGATEWIDDMQAVIHAFEGADISTPIHEVAHVMQRLMELYDPHGYGIASAFVGAKEGQAWTEEQHELFAKAFEQYCMDGKAPTVRLRDVFAKIKSWMVDLYRRLIHGDLGIKVSPEMRQVFDSWLTTEQEREANSLYELGDLDNVSEMTVELSQADIDAMQEYDYLKAKAHEMAIVKLAKDREKARNQEMKNLRALAVEMIEQTEFYDHLKDLKKFGGFNRASLLANGGIGVDDVTVLQGRKLINSDPGKGVNSGEFAHARGYESAEEFVRLVLDMPMTKKDAIERRYDMLVADFKESVEAEMLQLADAEGLIDAEIDILNQLLNRKPTSAGRKTAAKVLGVQTDEEYQNLKIKLSSMEKAAKDAYRAAMKTAKAEAKDAMSQAKEAQDAKIASLKEKHLEKVLAIKEEQKAIIARMRARNKEQVEIQKIKRGLQRHLRRKAMGFEYREQVRALLAQYMKVPKWQASDVPQVSLEKFLDDKATVWGSTQLLQDARKALPAATRFAGDNQAAMSAARFSLEDWENIKDLTDSLIYMDKWEREHDTEEAKREIADLAAGIYAARGVDPASLVMGEMIARDQNQPYWEKVKEFGARHLAELRKVEFLCIALDGGQRMGPVWKAVFSRVAKAYDAELRMVDDYTKRLQGILEPFLKRPGWASETFAFGGRQLTKEQVVLMALNSGDEYNLSKLRDGQNIRLDQESDEDCDARIRQFLEDTLSKEEWQLVYDVWGMFETLWPHIEATHHEMTGQKLKRTEGYYFPVIYDWKLSRLGVSDDRLATMDEIERLGPTGASDMIMRTPRHSARFERVGGRYPIRLEFSGISDALYSSIHDVNFTVTRRDVGRIIGSDQFRAAVENTLGEEVYEQFPVWLSEIARPSATIKNAVDRVFGWARRAGTVAMLSFKASTAMSQITAFTQTVEEIGPGYTAEGMQQFFKNPIEMAKFINEMSIEMKHRSQNFDRDIAQLWTQLTKSKGKQALEAVTKAGFSPIRFMDYMIAYPAWLGAYAKGVKENTLPDGSPDHDKACEYADMVVRLTQFSGATIELSKAQRGTETQKAMYMFATFFNGYYNRLVDTADRYSMGKISKFEAFKCVMLTTVLTSWLNIMLTELRLPEGWEWLGAPINYALSGVWMARDVAGAVQGFDYRLSPVAAVGKDIANAIHDTPAIMAGLVTGDFPTRTARDIIFTTGYALGLPAYQAWITYQGLNDLASGESKNPLDLLVRNYDVKR